MRRRLLTGQPGLPQCSPERRRIILETAVFYGISEKSLYRAPWLHLTRQPATVRFQAEHSNDSWQFDLSPSDLKQITEPPWLRPDRAAPTLMLFSSGPKPIDSFPFQSIPGMLYTD